MLHHPDLVLEMNDKKVKLHIAKEVVKEVTQYNMENHNLSAPGPGYFGPSGLYTV